MKYLSRKAAVPPRIGSATLANSVDTLLLVVCVTLLAIRCQVNEAFGPSWRIAGQVNRINIGGVGVTAMLVFAAVIFTTALSWLLIHSRSGALQWRKTALVLPLVIILAAAIISTTVASNQHTAIVGATNLIAQITLAVLLIQLINQPWKQRFVLCAVAATGVVMAYRCWEQYHYELGVLVDAFAEDPNQTLAMQGLEPGSFAAQQFAARITSRDVGGYFAISNTAASFFILSITATLAVMLGRLRRLARKGWALIFLSLLALAQIAGLFITASKGGIAAWLFAVLLLGLFWWRRAFLRKHWRGAVAAAILLCAVAVTALAAYGSVHGRLPSNSLWVRWQYWQSSADMIAEHGLTGVGAENFGEYYPRYMPAGAPEVVKDPHCFALAIWTQWGLLGIVGVIWAILAVCVHLVRPAEPKPNEPAQRPQPDSPAKRLWVLPIAMAMAIVIMRMAVSDLTGTTYQERASQYLLSFAMPTIIWLATFTLALAAASPAEPSVANTRHSAATLIALGSGMLAFLLHNTVDFAIFQPGVGTLFFVTVALAVAIRNEQSAAGSLQFATGRRLRAATCICAAALVVCFWLVIVLPVARSQAKMRSAQDWAFRAEHHGRGAYGINRIAETHYDYATCVSSSLAAAAAAAELNKLDPEPPYFYGRLSILDAQRTGKHDQATLLTAASALEQAAGRARADFRYYRWLSHLYSLIADRSPNRQKYDATALQYAQAALQRHPTSPELLLEYGLLLEEAGRDTEALNCYERALASESKLLQQQRQMDPRRTNITGRLNKTQTQLLNQRVDQLTHQAPPRAPTP